MIFKNHNQLLRHYSYLHSIPEPAFFEQKTKEYIRNELTGYAKLQKIYDGKYGLIYAYNGKDNSNVYDIAFRSELDAVEIEETSHRFYHGCGHDAHSSIFLTIAQLVGRCDINDIALCNILFVFQAGEEKYGGAEYICQVIQKQKIEILKMFALHVTPDLYSNFISINKGVVLAGGITCQLKIKVPDEGHVSDFKTNASEIFSQIVFNLRKFNSRDIRCKVSNFSSNGSHNVSPTTICLNITFRGRSKKLCEKIKDSFLDTIDYKYSYKEVMAYPAVKNSTDLYEYTRNILLKSSIISILETPFIFSCDDFSFYQAILNIQTCYIFIGAYDGGNAIHSDKFKVHENTLLRGLYTMMLLVNSEGAIDGKKYIL
ncbi:M20/M25/M40 family metallo-hydrolase [Lactococcus lactis]|uniref:M20/M25/M40 family metallo-hydrolase n=1 Tax=Lactococcus lactis TaxID=1358 RepID=UPI0022E49A9F|nr:M20/M25/M40 family metallo-hydrolase [Lactococcus lactis]